MAPAHGKSQRKRLQRQLEFYLSESNLRQDKFLHQAMDAQGFVPVRVLLSFNRLKMLKATERMILDAAEKSAMIQVDLPRACIAPKVLPLADQDDSTDARTIYIDSFSTTDDHDTLRRTFVKFGKVNLVSMPRFVQSKQFKGFGFVEFSEQSAAEEAVKASTSTNPDLRGIRVMSKTRWVKMKEQLKLNLSSTSALTTVSGDADDGEKDNVGHLSDLKNSASLTTDKKKKRRRNPRAGHVHFDEDENDKIDEGIEAHALLSSKSDEQDVGDGEGSTKKQNI
ncbi:hypothetical protein BBO99_00008370 [Phytophthora kernoviae]|uniref:HTH La-type RNA-binding domain-containing protein n=2 Tax=Phytophthora kernoviae TaxID=325452 RepID=A0A3R7JB36_9STRA|nr:hypothetical protein G195_008917 [Phytophthora kernoviae 00238/432]KAG2512381.1 hypothetical protein JM16_008100 [Phytophthora kernoviae]KAG2515897.1 hypothetical protein JM18_008053 [Phytophthora kernoviae]RLN31453.1 hypothetical protein BBI17_008305 [Phytophthora kernoviae]RLN75387.1 hypothetical protein BBO99_00008370 [Phytophthora kernoviae]